MKPTLTILLLLTTLGAFAQQDSIRVLACGSPSEIDTLPQSDVVEVFEDSTKIYAHVEQQPEFPGDTEALLAFLDATLQYPIDVDAEGKVILRFIVTKDGTIDQAKVVRGVHPLLDAEALRVVKLMPKWIPGKQRGKPVPVWFTLPVAFKLK